MPRPGLVLDVDPSTPPILFPHGGSLRLEALPPGSRVVYPPEPLAPVGDVGAAIDAALDAPLGRDPLAAGLRAGRPLVVAVDDVTGPGSPGRPDVRGRIVEAVLDRAAAAGVDDVLLVVARGLRRRLTDGEMRAAVGERVHDALAPLGLLVQHDAEDDDLVTVATTGDGDPVEVSRAVAGAGLVVYVTVTSVLTGGTTGSAAAGLTGARTQRALHRPGGPGPAEAARAVDRELAGAGIDVFQVEATLDVTATAPGIAALLPPREREWAPWQRAAARVAPAALDRLGGVARGRRRGGATLGARMRPAGVIAVTAGAVDAVRERVREHVRAQHAVPVDGQADVVTLGLPGTGPESRGGGLNPVLAATLALDGYLGAHTGRPVVRPGGVAIVSHPLAATFHPVHEASHGDFFDEVLPLATDPAPLAADHEERFATDAWYRHLYRTGHAHHGAHPFSAWYRAAAGAADLGAVIVVGGQVDAVRRLGFRPASTLADALEMATDTVGPDPSVTHLHGPAVAVADVTGP